VGIKNGKKRPFVDIVSLKTTQQIENVVICHPKYLSRGEPVKYEHAFSGKKRSFLI